MSIVHTVETLNGFDFSDEVKNVPFRVNDIDGDGFVTINAMTVNLSGGSKLTMQDTDGVAGADTADSQGGYESDTSASYSMMVDVQGPFAKIEIIHAPNGSNDSGINVTYVYYDAPVQGSSAVAGDDYIEGGAGDGVIYGDNGNSARTGEDASQVTLNFNNIEPGSETSNSVVYNNVAVLADGTAVSVRLVLIGKSDSNLAVDFTGSADWPILLNGDNNAGSDGDSATFELEFFDPSTGQPVSINSSLIFGDVDDRDMGEIV